MATLAAVAISCLAVSAPPAEAESRFLFRAPAPYDIGVRATADGVAIDDMDGDGRLDVVVLTSAETPSLTMRRQQPDGTLGPSEDLTGYVSAWAMDTGDVNGDGRSDIVTGNSLGTSVYTQGADGTFQGGYFQSTFRSNQVRVADVNGDGRDDLVNSGGLSRGATTDEVQVFLQDELGQMGPAVRLSGSGGGGRGMDLGDVDGDGRLDIVTVTTQGLGGYRQLSDGTWTLLPAQSVRETPVPSGDSTTWRVGAGDFDDDGKDDVALTWGYEEPRLAVFRSNGVGFEPPTQVTLPDPASTVRSGDLDGDGLDDVVAFLPNLAGVSVVTQGPSGLDAEATTYEVETGVGQYSDGVDLGDLDGDGLADLAVMGYYQTVQLNVLRHRGPDTAPEAPDVHVTTTRGAAAPVALSGADGGDGDPLVVTVDGAGPAHGTLTGRVPNQAYRPSPGYVGTDSFTYTVTDDRGGAATGRVSIEVGPAPPSAPQALAGAASDGVAELTWDPGGDDGGGPLTGYEVFRDGILVGTTDSAVVEYVDQGLSYGVTYRYTVVAVNAAGRSGPSEALDLSPLDTVAPTITLSTPSAAEVYPTGAPVVADYACDDGPAGSGIGSCVGTVPTGSAVDTTTAGSHEFTVTATDAAGNRADLERRYQVADARPDGWIRVGRHGTARGDDLYNESGAGQTRRGQAPRGRSVVYVVTAQNDGAFADRIALAAFGSSRRFRVNYVVGGVDVTGQVVDGTFQTASLEPGSTLPVTVRVTARAETPVGASMTRRLAVSSATHPERVDSVRFVTRVVRSPDTR